MAISAGNGLDIARAFAASGNLSDSLTPPIPRGNVPGDVGVTDGPRGNVVGNIGVTDGPRGNGPGDIGVTDGPRGNVPGNVGATDGLRGNGEAASVQRTILNTDGNDTFAIEKSDFNGTTIIAATGGSGLQTDIVRFGDGINPADLHFTRNGADLHISLSGSDLRGSGNVLGSSQVLIVRDFFLTTSAIDALVFADGSAILGADIWRQVIPNTLVIESTPTPGGGRREIAIDGAQTEPFTSVVTEYDASGAVLTQTQFLDNGTVSATVFDSAGHVVAGGAGADSLIGGAGNDVLQGGAGADVMDGGAGNDRMAGGTGSDAYYVDSLTDVVLERANEGADAAFVSVSGFALPDNVENGVITTNHGLTLIGNGLNNVLQGNAGADTLISGDGNDVVDPFAFQPEPATCGSGTSLWAPALRAVLTYRDRTVLNAGFAPAPVTMEQIDAAEVADESLGVRAPALVAFVRAVGLRQDDIQRLAVRTPDGTLLIDHTAEPLDRHKAQTLLFAGKKRPTSGWMAGPYTATYTVSRDGKIVLEHSFRGTLNASPR
jgi:Ca2+-binding RTX toxin-like protein